MTYQEWLASVPDCFKNDPFWRVEVYRLSMFVADIGWPDVTKLFSDGRTRGLADQVNRSIGSISTDVAEGYSRASHKDQARFDEYALGSTRESRNWYYQGRHVLTERVSLHRMELLTQIIRLLLTMIPNERSIALREASLPYGTNAWEIETVPFAA
jgi:four helix bundle protein